MVSEYSVSPEGLVWLASCGSTNDEAWARVDQPGVVAVAAHHQTSGRGRRGRTWCSPPGSGLYLSWIVEPVLAPADGGVLPLLAAVAVAELVDSLGKTPQLKWPNDVLVANPEAPERRLKIAGILCEARVEPLSKEPGSLERRFVAVVGIGLNLKTPPDGFPEDVPAIALDLPLDALMVASALLPRLKYWLKVAETQGFKPVVEAWRRFGPPEGTRMRQAEIEGEFLGLADDGALRLKTSTGEALIHAGDVELVVPHD